MEDKEKVLKTLKDFGRVPGYRISGICGIRIDKALVILQELADEGKVKKDEETVATYWRLNND